MAQELTNIPKLAAEKHTSGRHRRLRVRLFNAARRKFTSEVRSLYLCVYLIFILSNCGPPASLANENNAHLALPILDLQTYWYPPELYSEIGGTMLGEAPQFLAKIQHNQNSLLGTLEISKDGKLLYTFSPGLFPKSLLVAGANKQHLLSLWEAADGRIYLTAFSYRNGKIHQTLNADSLLSPEFTYPSNGTVNISNAKTSTGETKYYGELLEQKIIVAKTEFLPFKNAPMKLQTPYAADVYTWNDQKKAFNIERNIPWNKRFE